MNFVGPISQTAVPGAIEVCKRWGCTFYVCPPIKNGPEKEEYLPAWLIPQVSDAKAQAATEAAAQAPDSATAAPKRRKKQATSERAKTVVLDVVKSTFMMDVTTTATAGLMARKRKKTQMPITVTSLRITSLDYERVASPAAPV